MKPITPQPADWIDRATVRIVETREMAASRDDVFAVIADHERWPEWFEILDSVEKTNDIDGVGGTRRVTFRGITVDEEFTEWDPGRRFGFTLTAMSRPLIESMNERVDLEPLGEDRCRLTYTQGLAPKWWVRPLILLAKGQMRAGLRKGLDGLAKRVEA